MLAKVPAKRRDGKTSFKSLSKYACERDHADPETGEVSRRECSTETNCLDKDTAWREMKAVADMNGRVKDPVYHFVVSWPANEKPTDEQIFEAGRAGMKAVGMEGHQYLSVVHRDTQNAHGHFMVNRVNPETYKAVYPDRDHFKLDKTMREIELKQGWSHDKGPYAVHERDGKKVVDWAKTEPKHRQKDHDKLPGKARQMEVMTGNESLTTYAQGQPKKDAIDTLKKGCNWQDLHEALGRHGLEIKPKGQGFAIHSKTNPNQTPIKASTMAQELGGGKLKKQLGEYQEPALQIKLEKPQREYSDQRPKRDQTTRDEKRDERAEERRDMREQYKVFCEKWKEGRAPARAVMYDTHKQRQRALIDQHKERRGEIRNSDCSTVEKKALYSVAAFETAAKRAELAERIKSEREQFRNEKPKSFREWAGDRAVEGDHAAMRQVRGWAYQDKRTANAMQRADAQAERGPHLATASTEQHDPAKPRRVTERVSWTVDRQTGSVDYKVNDREAFRDNGRRIDYTAHGEKDKDSIEAGLLLAREKFAGRAIRVNGNDEFKERVLQTAIERRLDVRFSDVDLEQRREVATRLPSSEREHKQDERSKSRAGDLFAQLEAKRAERQTQNKDKENPLAEFLQQRQEKTEKASQKPEEATQKPIERKEKRMENQEQSAPEQAQEIDNSQQEQKQQEQAEKGREQQGQQQQRSRAEELLAQIERQREERAERDRDSGPELSR